MSYTIERLKNPQAYLVTLNEDFSFEGEYHEYHDTLVKALNREAMPVNVIVDMLKVTTLFEDLLTATKDNMSGEHSNPFVLPNVKSVIAVTNSGLIKLSIDGFIEFGIVKNLKAVDSVDEALRHVAD